ncbi:hypothetical protein BSNK01_13820 [Bacillaceae bacterium]
MGTSDPSAGKQYLQQAYNAIFRRDFALAISWFKKAIECEPNNPSYYYALSVTCARNNRLEEAIAAAKKALQLKPNYKLYHYHLDMLYSRQYCYQAMRCMERKASWNDCLLLLRKAIRLDPLNERAYLFLAMIEHKRGRIKQAIDALHEVLKLEPYHKEAKDLLDKYSKSL